MVINVKNKIIVLSLLTTLVSACSDDVVTTDTLSGTGEKTPLTVTALLDASSSGKTRAADNQFDIQTGDQLLAYIRHVKWDGPVDAGSTSKPRTQQYTAGFNKLVTFTANTNTPYDGDDIKPIGLGGNVVVATKDGEVTYQSSIPNTGIYWDDFSANSSADGTEASTYLRDENHYLQSYYGYCYNGKTGVNLTAEEAGTLNWEVATDQTAADKSAFKTSDLLWSAEQTPISYVHQDQQGGVNHGTLILPYTHAMSKVTIIVTLHESFGTGAVFKNVTTKLHEMFTTCTCTAPTYTLYAKGTTSGTGQTTEITMWNKESANDAVINTCTFEAIVVPSILSVVNPFATITGLDGNTYVIPITEAMLQSWNSQLTPTDEHINSGTAQARPFKTTIPQGKGFEMKSGVNYVLNVNISKQEITVSATIKDWVNVEAEGKAVVQFNSNVDGEGSIDEGLKNGGFDVFKNSVNTSFGTKTTTLSWNSTDSKWDYSPVIYWAGQQDASYFRAISPSGASLSMNQGTDMLWGYACDDDANNGSKVGTTSEVKITPRTGDVPLYFKHPMSKITVKLETATGDYNEATSPAVNLANAKIEISNLATSGTLSLVDGAIDPAQTKTASAITGTYSISGTTTIANLPVIPQDITDDAILKVTLKDGPNGTDGTVYKLKLNTCVDSNGTADPKPAITAWQRGKHYTYTIKVEKEKITFRAMIKKWDESTGSGNATLEWD